MCATISPATHRVAGCPAAPPAPAERSPSGSCRRGASSGRLRQISTPAPASSTTSTPARIFGTDVLHAHPFGAFARGLKRLRAHAHHLGDGQSRVRVCPAALAGLVLHDNVKALPFLVIILCKFHLAVPHDGRECMAGCTGRPSRPRRSDPPSQSSSKQIRGSALSESIFLPLHAAVKVERQSVLIPGVAKVHRNDVRPAVRAGHGDAADLAGLQDRLDVLSAGDFSVFFCA